MTCRFRRNSCPQSQCRAVRSGVDFLPFHPDVPSLL